MEYQNGNYSNCNNCGNYRPTGDYQNTNSSDRGSFAPLIILVLVCALAYFIYQNQQMSAELEKHKNCISVDSDGNMWFTKGDMSELVTPSNIWDELDKLGADDVEDYSGEVDNVEKAKSQMNDASDKQYDSDDDAVKDYSGEYTQDEAKKIMQ